MKNTKRLLIAVLIILMLTASAAALADGKTGRVVSSTPAYLEPEENDLYLAGYFVQESNVKIVEEFDNGWVNIEYLYDPTVLNTKTGAKEAAYNETPEKRTVYVLKSRLHNAIDGDTSNVNAIVTEEEMESVSGVWFNPDLLVDMHYVQDDFGAENKGIEFTTRTKTVGENADYRDVLLVSKNQPYINNTKFIYTPEVRIHGKPFYPIDSLAYKLPIEKDTPTYEITGDYLSDPHVIAGLREILKNSPPYKVYTGYTKDYVNASRTAASIAVLSFITNVQKDEYIYDIYSGLEAYNASDFSYDYFSYAYWLYEQGINAYTGKIDSEAVFISCDVQGEPVYKDGYYVNTVRITTNCPDGWRIPKYLLGTPDIRIDGANETGSNYVGPEGSTVIEVSVRAGQTAQNLNVPVYYNSNAPVIMFAVPDKKDFPVFTSLAAPEEGNPAKMISLSSPSLEQVVFKVEEKETGKPINDLVIELKGKNGAEYTEQTRNGSAIFSCVSDEYTYEVKNLRHIYDGSTKGQVNTKDHSTVLLEYDKKPITAQINVYDAFTKEHIEKPCTIEVIKEGDTEPFFSGVTENGVLEVTGLNTGNYTVRQTNTLKGYEKTEDVISLVQEENQAIDIYNLPLSGNMVFQINDKETNEPIRNVVIGINKDGTEVAETKTDQDGKAEYKLPFGDYTIEIKNLPEGTKLANEKERTVTAKSRSDRDTLLKWLTTSPKYQITIYPREKNDIDNYTENHSHISAGCDPSTGVYVLVAKENSEYYKADDVAAEFSAYDRKKGSYSALISHPGKYVIREIKAGTGYESYSDIIVTVKDRSELSVPIIIIPITKNINIFKTDENGKPLPGVVYHIYRSKFRTYNPKKDPECVEVITNESGTARVEALPFGEWVFEEINEKGKTAAKTMAPIDKSYSKELNLFFNGTDIPRFIHVTIKDAKGKKITGKTDLEVRRNGTSIGHFSIMDGEGISNQTYLPGDYTIIQKTLNYVPADEKAFTVTSRDKYEVNVEIVNTQASKGFTVRILKPVINGSEKVESDNNINTEYQYADKVSVLIKDKILARPIFRLDSTGEGALTTSQVPLGRYLLMVTNLPNGYYLEKPMLLINTEETTEKTANVDFVLKPYPSIVCLKLNDQGEGNREYGLYAMKNGENDTQELILAATTNEADGYISFAGEFLEGEYCIKATQDDEPLVTGLWLTPGSYLTINDSFSSNNVKIQAVDNTTGTLLNDAYIRISGDNVNINTEYIYEGYLENGELDIDLQPGEYHVIPVMAPEGYALNETENVITVNDSGEITGDAVLRYDYNNINIYIKDIEGEPVAGAYFELVNTKTKQTRDAQSDKDGSLTFTQLPFGKYEIKEIFPAPGYVSNNSIVKVTLDGVSDNSNNNTELKTDINRFYFKVLDYSGLPVCNAELALKNSQGSILQSTVTDKDGNVCFTSIPFGTYNVEMVSVPGLLIASKTKYPLIVGSNSESNVKMFTFVCKPRRACILLIDQNNHAIPGAVFELIDKDNVQTVETATTNQFGELEFQNFGYGEYIIRETKAPDNMSVVEDRELIVDRDWFPYEKIVFVSFPDYYDMKVIDNKGNVLPDILFGVVNTETNETRYVTSNENGIVHISGLSRGNYIIQNEGVPEEYVVSEEKVSLSIDNTYLPPEEAYVYVLKKKDR